METILELFKIDMGITHNLRDAYFIALITTSKKELEDRGIPIDEMEVVDQILISDYAAWKYRKRQEDAPLPQNLNHRIRNRIIQERARTDV